MVGGNINILIYCHVVAGFFIISPLLTSLARHKTYPISSYKPIIADFILASLLVLNARNKT
jgi:undecaprenyl pyrophosphate phosphatase UppP